MVKGSSKKIAFNTYKHAKKNVDAYKIFLNKYTTKKIKGIDDFLNIPIIDKKNYIHKYPLKKIISGHAQFIHISSGSTGEATLWSRNLDQEKRASQIHKRIFDSIFNINPEEATLVIICFAMGPWAAGNYTLAACKLMSKSNNITIATPGIEKEITLRILKKIGPSYKNIIIIGYPPFVADIIESASKKNIPIRKKISILTAGDRISEKRRDHLLKKIGRKDNAVINLYGSSDAGAMAYETPLSIFIRRQAEKDKKLFSNIFGKTVNADPALFQYDPRHVYFENVNGEIVLTCGGAIPLVRYNIHDIGRIVPYSSMKTILRENNILEKEFGNKLDKWKLPFLTVSGRSDIAVHFYAINIYPEQIEITINKQSLKKKLSGKYFVYVKKKNNGQENLHIIVELVEGLRIGKNLQKEISEEISEEILEKSIELKKLHSSIGLKSLPVINIKKFEAINFYPKRVIGFTGHANKKSKMLRL